MVKIKNILLLVLIVLLCTVAAYFYSNPLFIFFACALVFSVILSIIAVIFSSVNLSAALTPCKKTYDKDFVADITAEIHSGKFMCFPNTKLFFEITNVFYGEKCKLKAELPVISVFKAAKINIPVKSFHCGKIVVELKKITVSDFFNIISVTKKNSALCNVNIMPSLKDISLDTSAFHGKSVGEETQTEETSHMGDVITGVVPAASQSNIRNVHWKMTARKNQLMLKEYSESLAEKLTIFVELCENPNTNDEILSLLKSVSTILISSNKCFFISYYKENSEMPCEIKVTDIPSLETALITLYNTAVLSHSPLSPGALCGDVIIVGKSNDKSNNAVLNICNFHCN